MTQDQRDQLLICVDFDGTERSGVFRIYPANDESEPDCSFQAAFYYGTQDDGDHETRQAAQLAAHNEARRLAQIIGGNWASNE